MEKPVVEVRGLGKRYKLGEIGATTLHEQLGRTMQRLRGRDAGAERGEFWALREASFNVQRGDILGVIGKNGAGKSTLLKVMSRITEPTEGEVILRGRVSSLLEVGTGFHPELTGRENTYLNGTILGMRKREIDRKLDEIVAFAGIEKFLDTPVKRYSSGMTVRLGFAVAAHLEPEILIVDEVLAVGDAEFQKKCIGKMKDVAGHGRTVLFVSHNMTSIQNLCTRCIYMQSGKVTADADTPTIIRKYYDDVQAGTQTSLSERQDREGDGAARCQDVWFEDTAGQPLAGVPAGGGLVICLRYQLHADESDLSIALGIYDMTSRSVVHVNTETKPPESKGRAHGAGDTRVLKCHIDCLPLAPGVYTINVSIRHRNGKRADRVEGAARFDVLEADYLGTGKLPSSNDYLVLVPHQWHYANP